VSGWLSFIFDRENPRGKKGEKSAKIQKHKNGFAIGVRTRDAWEILIIGGQLIFQRHLDAIWPI
jgi:sarcosine oxidase delta subunit